MFSKENKGSQSVEDINFHDCCLLLFYFIVLHPTWSKNTKKIWEKICFQGQLIFEKKKRIKDRISGKFFVPSVFTW